MQRVQWPHLWLWRWSSRYAVRSLRHLLEQPLVGARGRGRRLGVLESERKIPPHMWHRRGVNWSVCDPVSGGCSCSGGGAPTGRRRRPSWGGRLQHTRHAGEEASRTRATRRGDMQVESTHTRTRTHVIPLRLSLVAHSCHAVSAASDALDSTRLLDVGDRAKARQTRRRSERTGDSR